MLGEDNYGSAYGQTASRHHYYNPFPPPFNRRSAIDKHATSSIQLTQLQGNPILAAPVPQP